MNPLKKAEITKILTNRFADDPFTSIKQLPHPHQLKDAQKAARLIAAAIQNNQNILVVGDYDVDGVTSCVIMEKFFHLISYQNARYIIPNRFSDGYGINPLIVEKNPADLIITVDNGISAFETGEYCKQNGITLIITDHHTIKDALPTADAIINPQQTDCPFPQKEICGASLAWYLCNAIKLEMGLSIQLIGLLDLVSIATIADMMPLKAVNKLLVKAGLKQFITSNAPANTILKSHLKSTHITAQDIAFSIAPLINSAGRMRDGDIAAKFLLSTDLAQAQAHYQTLSTLNQARKNTTQEILQSAQKSLLIGENCVIAHGTHWHEGVLGIVAANLSALYQRPAIVLSQKDNTFKGSARSYGDTNLIEAIKMQAGFLTRFGGHAQAVGLELEKENLEPFFASLQNTPMPKISQISTEEILGVLDLADIDTELLEILEHFEPYGQGNPQPSFSCHQLKVTATKTFKSLHQQLELSSTSWKQKAMLFFCKEFYQTNDAVDISFYLQREPDNSPLMVLKTITKCPL
ncbi:single-stranded-DNA-specific exonuclease RecJ [Helicobacter sp. 12S02634-8]|uniref:single-stranded-DNA-specific exonuclease RecJ n=1 Tax=Helicobacter sp. 12S02634-8 TaxID=1476199 RepID=UPI000BA5A942|nr:single-stranded-DNA-specific exonuclease RecJ [Helicobacter sp. 12S02634-8]